MSNKYVTEKQFEAFINKLGEDIYRLNNRSTSDTPLSEEFINKIPRILRMLTILEQEKDSDLDSLTDYEELEIHKTNPDVEDTDGDGYKDGVEIDAGSDPNSSDSTPPTVLSEKIVGFDPENTVAYFHQPTYYSRYTGLAYRLVDEHNYTVDISKIGFIIKVDGEEIYKQDPKNGMHETQPTYSMYQLAPQGKHVSSGSFDYSTEKTSLNLSIVILETGLEVSTTIEKENLPDVNVSFRAQGSGFLGNLSEKEIARDSLKIDLEESNIYIWSSRSNQYVKFNIKTNDNFLHRLLIDDVVLEGQNYPLYDYPFTGKTLVVDFPDLGKKFNLKVLEALKESSGGSYSLTHKFEKISEEVY